MNEYEPNIMGSLQIMDKLSAYKLADLLEKQQEMPRTVQMLRQQADRIAELEKVSKAKDRFPNYESICLQCGTTIYKPAKVKQLSDEEIEKIWNQGWNHAFTDIVHYKGFARAIIKEITE